jgi:hypothetical protein
MIRSDHPVRRAVSKELYVTTLFPHWRSVLVQWETIYPDTQLSTWGKTIAITRELKTIVFSLPDLNFDVFHGPGVLSDDCELFVRLSRTSDNKLLAEGFSSFNRAGGDLSLDDLDLSNWTELQGINKIAVLHGDQFGKEDHHMDPLCECMLNLTAVVVAVDKSTAKVCLVAAQNDFGGGDLPSDRNRSYSIDIFAREGYCWPRGCLSRCTHGRVDTDRLIKLGVLFEIVQDPAEECQWLLHSTWYDDD